MVITRTAVSYTHLDVYKRQTYLVASQIPGVGILALILKAIVSVIVSNLLMFVAYFKMGEFAEVKKLVIRVLKRQA